MYAPVLDGGVKSDIYRRNLPLGLPSTIKTLQYQTGKQNLAIA